MKLQRLGATWLLKACQRCLLSGSSFWGFGFTATRVIGCFGNIVPFRPQYGVFL